MRCRPARDAHSHSAPALSSRITAGSRTDGSGAAGAAVEHRRGVLLQQHQAAERDEVVRGVQQHGQLQAAGAPGDERQDDGEDEVEGDQPGVARAVGEGEHARPTAAVPTSSAVRGEANHEPAPRVIRPRAPYSSPAAWKGVVSTTITSSAR